MFLGYIVEFLAIVWDDGCNLNIKTGSWNTGKYLHNTLNDSNDTVLIYSVTIGDTVTFWDNDILTVKKVFTNIWEKIFLLARYQFKLKFQH